MNGVPDRVSIRSVSLFGLSVVTVTFEDDADRFKSRSLITQQLQQVNLPAGANASISPDSTPVGEIFRYRLTAPPGISLTELKAIEDFTVERQMRTIPNVVDISGFGGPTRQWQVLVDPAKLEARGISLSQVLTALSNGNANAGGAYIEHGQQLTTVRGLGLITSISDVERIVVTAINGTPVTIKDLGRVSIGAQIRLGRVGMSRRHSDGKVEDADDVVQGIVMVRRGANAAQVLEAIHAKVTALNAGGLPPGVRIEPTYDRSDLMSRTLGTVRHNMLEGITLVAIVLVLFLGVANLRSALIVASVIPLSLLGAFALLERSGVPANLISMGAIDFGIIVDAAVVVIENLVRLRTERQGRNEPLRTTIIDAVAQVGRPVLFSKLILLTAFIPLFTLERVEGRIFHPMALTLAFALGAGTLLAITVVPVLASLFARRDDAVHRDPLAVRLLRKAYAPILGVALRYRVVVLAAAALLIIGASIAAFRMGSEFLPKLDEGTLWIRASLPGSISPSTAKALVQRIRGVIASFPEVVTVVSQDGRPDDGTDVNGFNVCEMGVALRPRDAWTTAHDRSGLEGALNAKLREIPGVDFDFSQYIEDNVNEAVSGIKGELGVKIFGLDPATLQSLGDRVAAAIAGVPGAAGVGVEQTMGQPEVQVDINRVAIARYGMAVADVQAIISSAVGGAVATQILEGERNFDLVVKLESGAVSDLDAIRHIPVEGPNGQKLTLGDLATVAIRSGSGRIYREENQRRIAVHFSPNGRDLGSLVAAASEAVRDKVPMPLGYRMEWTGSFENQQRALARLAVVVPITLAVVFFLLMTAFDSMLPALLILVNVPLAVVGGIAALLLADLPLSVSALVGFIALFGVSVQNGVLLLERVREMILEGKDRLTAVREGALERLRPVFMTSAMAALGLAPAALSTAVGAETARPFALVIVGGLVSATLLTLVVLPILASLFNLDPRVRETGQIRRA